MNHSDLLNVVSYDKVTGKFVRLQSAGNALKGTVIGNEDKKGYVKALVLGQYVKLHRLAWFYIHGCWPSKQIDHLNGIRSDNRIDNLRDCGTSENCLNQHGPRTNNKSGYQGVHQILKTGRSRATCSIQGRKHHIGVFSTAEEASCAYIALKAPHLPESI